MSVRYGQLYMHVYMQIVNVMQCVLHLSGSFGH